MIKFFRTIRLRSLSESDVGRYILYALGEITLVVIGILIALAINNWNEEQKERNLEQAYLFSLHDEFQYNLVELERAMNRNSRNIEAAVKLSNLMGPAPARVSEEELAILTDETINTEVQIRPNQAVLSEMISSGRLGIFQDAELKFGLSSWNGMLYKVQFQEREHAAVRMKLIGLMNEIGNTRKAIQKAHGEIPGVGESKFMVSNLPILQSLEFDNILIDFILTARYLNSNYYGGLKEKIREILRLIEKELED